MPGILNAFSHSGDRTREARSATPSFVSSAVRTKKGNSEGSTKYSHNSNPLRQHFAYRSGNIAKSTMMASMAAEREAYKIFFDLVIQ